MLRGRLKEEPVWGTTMKVQRVTGRVAKEEGRETLIHTEERGGTRMGKLNRVTKQADSQSFKSRTWWEQGPTDFGTQ